MTTPKESNKPLYQVLYEKVTDDNRDEGMKAFEQYRELATENFRHLAQALEGWIEYFDLSPDEALSEAELHFLNKTKEALARIS